MQTSRLVTLALLACGALAAVGRGQDILITPTAITSSTSGTDSFSAVHLIDGSGLSNTPTLANLGTHAAPDSSNAWVTTDSSPDYFLFLPNPVLTCALGSTHFVSELVLWGDDGSPNEAKSFTVTFSIDGTRFSNAINLTSPARLGGFPTRLPFPGGARVASHVRVTVTDNYYSFFPPRTAGGDRVGLGEIRFAGQSYGSVIVDNLANSTDGEDFLDPANGAPNKVAAHAFTTGPAPLVLESITLRMRNAGGSPNAHAKLWSGAGSVPVTELADLGEVTVTSVMDAEHTFVGGGVILAASTRYWVTVRNEIASAALSWAVTSNGTSIGSGSLGTTRALSLNGGTNWGSVGSSNIHLLKVTGVSPFVVTNTNDFNFGSLRYAMAIADDSAGADTITFASTLAGQTITLNSSEGGGSARA